MIELMPLCKRVLMLGCALALVFPAAASASQTFNGDFDTGDLSQWNLQQFCPGDATVYDSDSQPSWPQPPQGWGALQLSVPVSHVLAAGAMDCAAASGSPRAQIGSNRSGAEALFPGDDKWESWWVLIPADFPVVSGWRNWFVTQEDYGAPFSGSPPVAFDITDTGVGANQFVMAVCHDGCPATTTTWASAPIEPDHWYHFVVHKVFSTDDSVGAVELWLDGERQTFYDLSQTYHTRTLHANCTCTSSDAYRFYLNNYHAATLTPGSTTVYFDGASISDSDDYGVSTGSSTPRWRRFHH